MNSPHHIKVKHRYQCIIKEILEEDDNILCECTCEHGTFDDWLLPSMFPTEWREYLKVGFNFDMLHVHETLATGSKRTVMEIVPKLVEDRL